MEMEWHQYFSFRRFIFCHDFCGRFVMIGLEVKAVPSVWGTTTPRVCLTVGPPWLLPSCSTDQGIGSLRPKCRRVQ